MIACKICNPPAAELCSRCEANVNVQVLEATDRIRARLSGISRAVNGAVVMKERRFDGGNNQYSPVTEAYMAVV